DLARLAVAQLGRAARAVLDEARLAARDVEWFLPHQPNGPMFEAIIEAMEIDRARTVEVVREIGSVGAAAIPVSLDRLMRSGRVEPGDRMLLAGVGAGPAWGALLYRVAP